VKLLGFAIALRPREQLATWKALPHHIMPCHAMPFMPTHRIAKPIEQTNRQ
jgi:hypothetical protein